MEIPGWVCRGIVFFQEGVDWGQGIGDKNPWGTLEWWQKPLRGEVQ